MQIELTENELKVLMSCVKMAKYEGYYLLGDLKFDGNNTTWDKIGIEFKSALMKLGLEEDKVNRMWDY